MDFEEIEIKHKDIINKAKLIMNKVDDPEHNLAHVLDVVNYIKQLTNKLEEQNMHEFDKEVCIVSSYWHDVGRSIKDEGHEELSAKMLKDEMIIQGYDDCFIEKCYKAIEKHKWNMHPETIEGLILKDADKLAFLGKNRWKECLDLKKDLDSIIRLLPKLKREILFFNESKEIYDKEIIELINLLYSYLAQ